jgi:hypothetical protein
MASPALHHEVPGGELHAALVDLELHRAVEDDLEVDAVSDVHAAPLVAEERVSVPMEELLLPGKRRIGCRKPQDPPADPARVRIELEGPGGRLRADP